ncbi:hypothetical protein ABZ921_19325 [Streptomyces atriruber]|uniref:Albusnodin family lasso peptide n=1 Tax=Streptomyces atriruber TaxID=545121 RepID=A0ABV3BP77_9ACTN
MTPPVATTPAVATKPTPVKITSRPEADVEGIEFLDDLDAVAGNEIMRGCGDDNPY